MAGQVAQRCATESYPTPEARLVLLALVRARAEGRQVPAQEVFARQLGLKHRRSGGAWRSSSAAGCWR